MFKRLLVTLLMAVATAGASGPVRAVYGIAARVASLDPFTVSGIEAYEITGHVVEPLARLNAKTRELMPCLALRWEIDQSKNKVRIFLREGVRFHDGSEFSAEDVKFTFDAYFDPRFNGEIWRAMWSDVASVRVMDRHQVEFEFKKLKYQSFENLMTSLRILPRKAFQTSTQEFRRSHLLGTGPFKVESFEPNRSLRLMANKNWWSGQAPNFEVLVKSVSDLKLAQQLMNKSELDYYEVPISEASSILKDPQVKAYPALKGEGVWLHLNLRHPVLADAKVREALLLLWNRGELNQKIFSDQFRLALDIFSPQMSFYPAGKPEPYDLLKAKSLLRSVGWEDSDKDGVLDKKILGQTTPLKLRLLVRSSQDERWLSLYQANAASAGVKIIFQRVQDEALWWKLVHEGKFDAGAGSGGLDTSVLPGGWRSGAYYNISGYSNAEVDRRLDQLENEFDPRKRSRIQQELIKLVRADRVAIPGLYSPNSYFLVSQRLDLDPESPTKAWRWRLKDQQFP